MTYRSGVFAHLNKIKNLSTFMQREKFSTQKAVKMFTEKKNQIFRPQKIKKIHIILQFQLPKKNI
jgi:hypothetical protein